MRILFPILTLFAVVLFGVSAVVSLILSFALPLLLVAFGAAAFAGRYFSSGIRIMHAGFKALGGSFTYMGDFFRCLFAPLSQLGQQLDDGRFPEHWVRIKPAQFIQLHRVQQEVAAELNVATVDELWMSPDTSLGIGETRLEGKRVRFMIVGLGLVMLLSPEELRAVIAHEYGHSKAGHVRLGRWIRHTLRMLLDAQISFSWFNPARWGSRMSYSVMRGIYLPWSRAREYQADRYAGQVAGAAHIISALRKLRDSGPALDVALNLVLRRITETHRAPRRLVESAQKRTQLLPPDVRKKLAQQAEGDPLDLGGRTHPPTASRIAALSEVKVTALKTAVAPFDLHALAMLDERLTREWLGKADVRQWLAAEEFFETPASPAPSRAAVKAAESPTSDGLELDLDRDWQKRRAR